MALPAHSVSVCASLCVSIPEHFVTAKCAYKCGEIPPRQGQEITTRAEIKLRDENLEEEERIKMC